MGNPSHNALSAIASMTPPIFFSDACLRPCSTGRGSTDPGRPWLHHYPILSLTGFLQSKKIKFPEKEEGYPGRTPLRVHRPRIPASFVIPGSLLWVSRLLPGFRRSPADLHRHHEPVSFTTTERMPFLLLPSYRFRADMPVFPVQPGAYELFTIPGLLAV
jgi:hypothetical protein